MDLQATELSGWGNYPRIGCRLVGVEHPDDVVRHLHPQGTIARGLGRSYGDAALNDEGVVLGLARMDRYVSFDAETGVLECEAGASLESILRDFLPRGWMPLVTPGTKYVTVGGCIANDVHGKAHHADGSFQASVEDFEILVADGRVVRASRTEHPDLFWANFGGMGLLGIILRARLRLRRVETAYFKQRAIRVGGLDELAERLSEFDSSHPYSVAWVDPLATGRELGRGVLTIGDHASLSDLSLEQRADPLPVAPPSPLFVPFEVPTGLLNRATIRLVNRVIDQTLARGGDLAHYEGFFYPLDAIGDWNRGYGHRGFTQYQFVIPLEDGVPRMRAILERIARSRFLPFLNVLKRLGPEAGVLSFPRSGYTFAIDFPIRDGLAAFLESLDELVIEAGGRVYLGKDAFVSAESLSQMYPQLDTWLEAKRTWDPDDAFTSNLARRVGLTSG